MTTTQTTQEHQEHPPISLEHAVRILSTFRAEVRARSLRQAELAEVAGR